MINTIGFRYHMTPLMYAAREGKSLVVLELLKGGAGVDMQDHRGWTVRPAKNKVPQ